MANKKIFFGILVMVLIFGMMATGCASGPKFGNPTSFQATLNELANRYPIEIGGRQIRISFEGNAWRGTVDGKDALAGDCRIDVTFDNGEIIAGVNMENIDAEIRKVTEAGAVMTGAIITLNQSFVYVDSAPTIPIIRPTKWQKTPGPEIVIEYTVGPPETLSKK